ncbi:MAG: DUF3341 domain-containing protein [Labilithrix sp.]
MKKAVVGTVENASEADSIVKQLLDAGFLGKDISVLYPDPRGENRIVTKSIETGHTHAADGAIAGAGAGALTGGSLGLLAGIGALAIPGLGPFIAAGPIVATLSGLLGGAAVGGFAGSLVGLGIPEEEARRFEKHIRGGGALIAVHVENRDAQSRALNLLSSIGASEVGVTPPSSREAHT